MSTKFTRPAMPTTPPKPLTVLFQTASEWIMQSLLTSLAQRGYTYLTEAHISLIGNLDCGSTHASAVAKRMGVSRQAIYRTVRELQALDVLLLENDPVRGNQKNVVMTGKGIHLVDDARTALLDIEKKLAERIGTDTLEAMRKALEASWGEIVDVALADDGVVAQSFDNKPR